MQSSQKKQKKRDTDILIHFNLNLTIETNYFFFYHATKENEVWLHPEAWQRHIPIIERTETMKRAWIK